MNKRIKIVLLISLFFNCAKAQTSFVSNNATGDGIVVKWLGEEMMYKEGVNIYRKESNSEWELIKKVVPPSQINSNSSENEKSLFEAFLVYSPKEFKESFDGIFFVIEAVENNNFAKAVGLMHEDNTVVKGNTYQYKIEGIVNGKKKEIGITKQIKHEVYSVNKAPESININRKRKITKIKWKNDVFEYYAYNVYIKAEGEKEWRVIEKKLSSAGLAEGSKKVFLEIPTNKDTAYVFKIEAIDYFGQTTLAKEVPIKIIDLDPPYPPNMRIKPHSKNRTARISWDKPVDKDVAGYNVLRATEDEDDLYKKINTKLIPATDTVYNDQLNESGVYFYRVEILDEAGNKSKSFPQLAEIYDLFPPPVPQNLSAVSDTGKLILKWDRVQAIDLKGYVLYRSVSDDNNEDNLYVPVSPFHIDTNYYEEEMAANVRNEFIYVIKSIDSLLNESDPSNPATVQLPDVTPPVAPFIKETFEDEGFLGVKWMPNLESDLQGYNLYKRTNGDTSSFQKLNGLLIPSSLNVYRDKEAQRGIFYEYYLEAVDKSGLVSKPSNDILGKLNHLELSGNIVITKNKLSRKNELVLEWDTDSLYNEPVVGSAVYRSLDTGLSLPITKVLKENKLKDKPTKPGKYTYHIRVYGERGSILKSEEIEINITKQ